MVDACMWIDGITLTFHLTAGFDLGLDEEAGRRREGVSRHEENNAPPIKRQ